MLCYRCGSHVADGSSNCGNCGQTFTVRERRPSGPPRPRRKAPPNIPEGYQPGEKIAGRYEVKSVAGQGPIGVVYRAMDREVDVEVAVKVVTPKLIQSKEERQAFRRENRLVRSISHVGCVRLYEDGFDGDRPFLVMQYLEGLSLRKIIDLRHGKNQSFSLEEVEPIFQQLCGALAHAHRIKTGDGLGIAHGHLKPQNVIVLPDILKVVDFREACFIPRVPYVAAQRVRGGEVGYLAPEVIEGRKVTAAADVYGLGILLGEMLAGQVGTAEDGLDLSSVQGVPRGMDGVFRRLTAPRPEDRYSKISEVLDDVRALMDGKVPPHASRRQPMVAVPRGPTGPEVLATGEFELLDAGDESEIDVCDDDIEEIGDEASLEPDEAPPPVAGGRRRDTFGLEPPAPPLPPPEALEEGGDEHLDEKDLGSELFDDIGSDGGVLSSEGSGGTVDEEPPARDEPTVVGRRRDVGRVARVIGDEADPAPDAAPPPPPAEVTDPGWELPTDLHEERQTPRGRAKESRRTKRAKPESARGWGRFVAVVAASAVAGLAVAVVASGQVREAFGIADLFATPPPAEPTPISPPLPDTDRPDPGEGESPAADPEEGDDGAPAAGEDGREGEAAPVETPSEPAKVTTPDRPQPSKTRPTTRPPDRRPTPAGHKTTTEQPPSKRPPEPTPPPEERKVAAVTPSPGPVEEEPRQSCPDGMVFIPEGTFRLGSALNDPMRNFAEHALAEVRVDAYCMDRYEYGGRGRQPVTGVTWYRAQELCESRGRRLCTEEEWERACKGPRNLRFPYGNSFDPAACNTEDADGNPRDVAAGGAFSRCRSGFGVFDMAGNVAEWTASRFQEGLQDRTHKGGAANRPDWDTRCATRGNRAPNARDPFLGFRCCADPE